MLVAIMQPVAKRNLLILMMLLPKKFKLISGYEGLDDLIRILRQIRTRLQAGALRPDAWPKRR